MHARSLNRRCHGTARNLPRCAIVLPMSSNRFKMKMCTSGLCWHVYLFQASSEGWLEFTSNLGSQSLSKDFNMNFGSDGDSHPFDLSYSWQSSPIRFLWLEHNRWDTCTLITPIFWIVSSFGTDTIVVNSAEMLQSDLALVCIVCTNFEFDTFFMKITRRLKRTFTIHWSLTNTDELVKPTIHHFQWNPMLHVYIVHTIQCCPLWAS